jgi:hypothetical protein
MLKKIREWWDAAARTWESTTWARLAVAPVFALGSFVILLPVLVGALVYEVLTQAARFVEWCYEDRWFTNVMVNAQAWWHDRCVDLVRWLERGK